MITRLCNRYYHVTLYFSGILSGVEHGRTDVGSVLVARSVWYGISSDT